MIRKKHFFAIGAVGLVLAAGGVAVAQVTEVGGPSSEHVALQETEGRVPVGDDEGRVRGAVDSVAMDRMSQRAGAFLSAHDLTFLPNREAGVSEDPSAPALAVSDAVMDLEAIPVFGRDGSVVGWFGAGFIEPDDLAARREAAGSTLVDVTGEGYQPS